MLPPHRGAGIFQVLAEKVADYDTMSAELIAKILWQVFVDGRECFSHLGPGLPESPLNLLGHEWPWLCC